jgi:O-antigen/teichoic acid export membrane protein
VIEEQHPEDPAPRQSIARNARSLIIAQSITWPLSLIMTAVAPRFLGPDNVGKLGLAASIWAIAQVFIMFGLNSVIVVNVARDRFSNEQFQSAMGLELLAYLAAWVAVAMYAVGSRFDSTMLVLLILAGVSPLLSSYGELARAVFYGRERMTWPTRVDIVMKALTVALMLLVLVAGGRAIAVSVLGGLLAIVYVVLMLRGVRRVAGFSLRPQLRGVRALARLALPFLLIDAAVVVYRQSDTVILSAITTSTQVGWYNVSETFLGSLLIIPTVVLAAAFPALARTSNEDPQEGLRLVRRGVRLLLIVNVPIGLGSVVVAPQLAPALFGQAFKPSAGVLAAMGLVMIVMTPAILVGNFAIAVGKQSEWVWITIVALLTSIPLHMLLDNWTERQYGNAAIGAAFVFVITEGLILGLAIWRITPTLIDRDVAVATAKTMIAGLLMLAAAYPLRWRLIVLPIGVGAIVYIGLNALLRTLTAEDRRLFGGALRKIAGRLGLRSKRTA